MNRADILILARDAEHYPPLLQALALAGARMVTAERPSDALRLGNAFPVVLGQPGHVAACLQSGMAVEWVQSTWAGVTPLVKLGRRDYLLTGIKGLFGPQITEYLLAYLLAHELRLLERLGRQAGRNWWPEHSGTLRGRTLVILGTGSIGRHVAESLARLGVRVLGVNRRGQTVDGFTQVVPVACMNELLAQADYLLNTLPETPATEGLLDRHAFGALKTGCYLVNVGRGSVIDEAALLAALESGRLAGAALDVFTEEPLPADSPLWHAPGVLVTAHIAARSHPADIAALFIDNYQRYREGRELRHRVDFDRGY